MGFADNIFQFAMKVQARSTAVFRGTGRYALQGAILVSPVKTGRFRNNWNTSLNEIDTRTTLDTDPSGQDAVSRGLAVIERAQIGESIFIANSLPYAIPLNNGSSQQAPAGIIPIVAASLHTFVEQSVAQAQSEVP